MTRITSLISVILPCACAIMTYGEDAPGEKVVVKKDGTLNNIDIRLSLNGGSEGITQRRNEVTDAEVDFDRGGSGGLSIHVLYLRAPAGGIGFAVGGGFSARSHVGEQENTTVETTVSAAGVDIQGAFVYRPTKQWHFELPAVVLTSGVATVKTDGVKDAEDGDYNRFALQVGAYYTFDFGLQLGADLGVAGFTANVDQELIPNVKQEIIYSGGGGFINLSAGFRF